MDGRRVRFDFQNHTLAIEPSLPSLGLAIRPSETMVRADGSHGRLRAVSCFVDGVPAAAFLDSGADVTVGNTRLASALQEHGARFDDANVVELTGVTGGAVPGRPLSMDRIKLGAIAFHQPSLIVADLPVFDVWGLMNRPALFIGMDFLRLTRSVTVDYGLREYLFKLADIRVARQG